MTRIAAHINDATITATDGSSIVYREPGFALLLDDNIITGSEAFAQARINPRRIQNRYWSELTTDPLADRRFSHLTAADLVIHQLEDFARSTDNPELVFAVPGYMTSQNLGLLLGICSELNLPVAAMVDSAVAATRREYTGAVPVHIDISLHSVMMSRLSQPGRVQLEGTEILPGCGIYALFDAWVRAASDAFVQQSRFDPLHTAATEQLVLDRMGGWLSQAARNDRVQLEIEYKGTTYEASLESLALIGAAAPIYQQIANKLRALFRADEVPAIQVTERVARLTGLVDILKARVGGEVYALEPGATARGALARCRDLEGGQQNVALIRQMAWDQAPVSLAKSAQDQAQTGVPTHLLYGNSAYSIGNSALIMGSEESDDGVSILVDSEMPGVSRRHCGLNLVNGQCVLEDFSRYGTYLNGHRIDGSAILQIGDFIQIGSPGYEFRMITTSVENG